MEDDDENNSTFIISGFRITKVVELKEEKYTKHGIAFPLLDKSLQLILWSMKWAMISL